jgi:hypothetical protein
VTVLALAAIVLPCTAQALPPPNDAFDAAVAITLPSTQSIDVSEATLESGEPSGWCFSLGGSVWYRLQPSQDTGIRITSSSSPFFERSVNVYRQSGSGLSGLTPIGCGYSWSDVSVRLVAGETYYVQAGFAPWSFGGLLDLTFQMVPPPANDDFADATAVGSLPYSNTANPLAATIEPGEPMPSCGWPATNSHWYSFHAPAAGSYTAHTWSGGSTFIGLYRGTGLGSLSEIGCRWGGPITFRAEAGERTYVQIVDGSGGASGPVTFNLDVAPAPSAQFWYSPENPTRFDPVSFFGNWFDPGGNAIVEQVFEFGDGSTASGCCPQHTYSSDGDYIVRLRVKTSDGRVATAEQTVHVRTHDVAITRFSVPQIAQAGQTREIMVGVRNSSHPEDVTVELYRSRLGGGFDRVGTLTQAVPVRSGNRTTSFPILYTFTNQDAVAGKVTFKAVAILNSAVDSLPADNEAIAPPTRVTG